MHKSSQAPRWNGLASWDQRSDASSDAFTLDDDDAALHAVSSGYSDGANSMLGGVSVPLGSDEPENYGTIVSSPLHGCFLLYHSPARKSEETSLLGVVYSKDSRSARAGDSGGSAGYD